MVKQQASRKNKMKQSRTLDCEDDVRDLSIILTDKILNKFDRTTPDETTAFDPDEFPCKYGFKGAIIPLDKNYSFDLQDLITEIICKEYKIEKDE
jgi:hypothetical protein|tara:strand:- start:14 stop:298 length:285 start_codon:yes stop_codon:yes gene_type:complete